MIDYHPLEVIDNFKHVSKNDTNITPQKSVDMNKNDYIREILKGWFHYSGDCLYTSESDVCRRQILTYKDGLRTERIKNI